MLKLANNVAIVTGASQGLGRGIALTFAREGCRIVLAARSAALLDAVAAECQALGAEALAVPTDVADEAQIEALFARTLERFGRLDVLVNNAAMLGGAPLEALPTELWQRAIDVNLTAPLLCTRAAFRIMKPQGGGRIINIASIASQRVRPDSAPYSATKHGLWGLTQSAALDGRSHGIVVSCLYPGNIRTEKRSAGGTAFNEEPMMSVEEVADGVLFMAAQPAHLNILEMTMLPVGQAFLGRG